MRRHAAAKGRVPALFVTSLLFPADFLQELVDNFLCFG
jgi:hypothetical protein